MRRSKLPGVSSQDTTTPNESNLKSYRSSLTKREGTGADPALKILVVVCLLMILLFSGAVAATAQVDADLVAKRRLFAPVGPGLKQIREGTDGKIYVLASPSPGLVVFSPEARRLLTMREAAALPEAALAEAKASGEILVEFGEDCDVDADGTIYIADRAANNIQVYS